MEHSLPESQPGMVMVDRRDCSQDGTTEKLATNSRIRKTGKWQELRMSQVYAQPSIQFEAERMLATGKAAIKEGLSVQAIVQLERHNVRDHRARKALQCKMRNSESYFQFCL